jgi:putative ABC transport system ATP-binding protein
MKEAPNQWQDLLRRLAVFARLEKSLLQNLLIYAVSIAILYLIIPLTVQEMVNTFAYAIQPVMVFTLVLIMMIVLLVVGGIRALQYYAVEMLERRIFARIALAQAEQVPALSVDTFKPKYANRFVETMFLQRALSILLIDGMNVAVGGLVGLGILVFYHPYFLVYNLILVAGVLTIVFVLGLGGHRATLAMSHTKYETLAWIQELAHNVLQFKVTDCREAVIKKTDGLIQAYIEARQQRFGILLHQYLAWVGWQALGYSGLVGFAGWLLAIGELTLGQFVAAEVIIGSLLISLDSVVKRMPHAFYLLTAVTELDSLFSLSKDLEPGRRALVLPDPRLHGLHVICHNVGYAGEDGAMLFEHLDLDVKPGSRLAIEASSSSAQLALARVLAGVYRPSAGSIRYNGVDLRDLNPMELHKAIGVVFEYQPTLFEGTLADNITMGRPAVDHHDIRWALDIVELEEEIDGLPQGLRTPVIPTGKAFTTSLVQRILIARAVVGHPQLLMLEGTLPSVSPRLRDRILRQLATKERPWSMVCIACEPIFMPYMGEHIVLP